MSFRRKLFTEIEKQSLMACVEKYKKIIANPLTNGTVNRDKSLAWDKVTIEFNSLPGVSATTKSQLQDLYRNLKKRAVKAQRKAQEELSLPKITEVKSIELDSIDMKLIEMGVIRPPLPCPEDSDCIIGISESEHKGDDPDPLPLDNASNNVASNSPSSPLATPTPTCGTKFMTSYSAIRKRRGVKAANALHSQPLKTQLEEEHELLIEKISLEIQHKLNSEQRAEELHSLERDRLLREESRAAELHSMKLKVLEAKLDFYKNK